MPLKLLPRSGQLRQGLLLLVLGLGCACVVYSLSGAADPLPSAWQEPPPPHSAHKHRHSHAEHSPARLALSELQHTTSPTSSTTTTLPEDDAVQRAMVRAERTQAKDDGEGERDAEESEADSGQLAPLDGISDRERLRAAAAQLNLVSLLQTMATAAASGPTDTKPADAPRVMLLLYPRKWPAAFYIHAMGRAGFTLSAVAAANETNARLLTSSQLVHCYQLCGSHVNASCLVSALGRCQPRMVVALSDVATAALITLAEAAGLGSDGDLKQTEDVVPRQLLPQLTQLRGILRSSLPAKGPRRWYALLDKSRLVYDIGHLDLGLKVPRRAPLTKALVQSWAADPKLPLEVNGEAFTLPVVIKSSRGVAGQGVRIAKTRPVLIASYYDLDKRIRGERKIHNVVHKLDGTVEGENKVFMEAHYPGKAAMLNLVAIDGRILGAFTLWKNQTDSLVGPSQTNTLLHHQGMLDAAKTFAEALGYNGFLGLEFMVDQRDGQAYLIDVNPRINPGSIHAIDRFGWLPLDLPTALRRALVNRNDPLLGLRAPNTAVLKGDAKRGLPAGGPIFVKWDYRGLYNILRTLKADQNAKPESRRLFTHAPWCDPGMMRVMREEFKIEMDRSKCLVTVLWRAPAIPPHLLGKSKGGMTPKPMPPLTMVDSPCNCD